MRLFLALRPPEPLAQALSVLAEDAARRFGGRPARRATLHLTLAFLGDVPDSRLDAVGEACRVASQMADDPAAHFVLRLDHLACWEHNRLLWAGCSHAEPGLSALVGCLRSRLAAAGVPVDGADRPYVPHVSLVRHFPAGGGCDPAHWRACLNEHFPSGVPEWPCTEFVLFESRLNTDGAMHAVRAVYPLRHDAGVA